MLGMLFLGFGMNAAVADSTCVCWTLWDMCPLKARADVTAVLSLAYIA